MTSPESPPESTSETAPETPVRRHHFTGDDNPIGLRKAADEQFHGTLAAVLVIAVLGSALIGYLFLQSDAESSIGTRQAGEITRNADTSWQVTFLVSNRGTTEATDLKCRALAQNDDGVLVSSKTVEIDEVPTEASISVVVDIESDVPPASATLNC